MTNYINKIKVSDVDYAITPTMPAGIILPFAGTSAPSGYLLCSGQSISRTDYSELFSAIGTTWGSNSATTFNIPDLRGTVLAGSGTTNSKITVGNHSFGTYTGEENVTLTVDQIPSHGHSMEWSASDGDNANWRLGGSKNGESEAAHSGIGYTGGGKSHNNMQPTAYINYIISTGKLS